MSFTLARWFTAPVDASGPADDFIREEILNEAYRATAVAVEGQVVMVKTPQGVLAIERKDDIVDFDFVENGSWAHTRFWMNASSVRDLGIKLRALPRCDFNTLFAFGGVR